MRVLPDALSSEGDKYLCRHHNEPITQDYGRLFFFYLRDGEIFCCFL